MAYHALNLPAQGEMKIIRPEGPRTFPINCADVAFVNFARFLREGGYEPEVTAFFDRVVAGGQVVYDIGANWGYYCTLLATNSSFTGAVHAFEIAPGTYRELQSTILGAGLQDRVTCHQIGLSSEDGELPLVKLPLVKGHDSTRARIDRGARRRRTEMVRVKRLDSLDLPAPDLLKIDVEGHELDVLTGGTRLIDQCRPVLVMENSFHDREPERTLRPLTFLEHRGYELYQLMWEVEVDGRYFLTRRLPAAGDGAVNTLALVPLCSEDRLAIPLIINVVACPRERSVGVAGRFEQRAP